MAGMRGLVTGLRGPEAELTEVVDWRLRLPLGSGFWLILANEL